MTPAAALVELIAQLREAERLAWTRWERAVIVGADPREVAALDRAHVAAVRARTLAEAHAELGGLREVGLGDARERAEASGRRWSPPCEATEERCAVATKARAPTPAFRVVSGARPPLRPSPT